MSKRRKRRCVSYTKTLINDYEMLAIGAAQEAERIARYREDALPRTAYRERLRLTKQESFYRTDSLRFQWEADRLRGTNARRE